MKLSIDDEEFKRLNDEEFEKKLIETLMTTLSKTKGDDDDGELFLNLNWIVFRFRVINPLPGTGDRLVCKYFW